MPDVTRYEPGTFSWWECGSTDQKGGEAVLQ